MHLSDFHVKTDAWPLVSPTDELVIVFRDAINAGFSPVAYVGAHDEVVVSVRTAGNREALETATPTTTTIPAGGKTKIDLAGAGNPLNICSKITVTGGGIFVGIAAFGEFDAYFKQITVPNS